MAEPGNDVIEHEAGHRDPYAALRVPAFRRYSVAFILSVIAGQVQTAAVGWEIYDRSGSSALDLGWLGLVLAIPMLILSLPAGQIADWFDRKKLFMFQQISLGLCAIGLTIVSWKFSHAPHALGIMYLLLGLGAAGATIGRPSREALMSGLIPAELYPNAITWNSTSFETSSMIGPAIGGLIVWLSSPAVAYFVSAIAWAIALALIGTLPSAKAEPKKKDGKESALTELTEGIRFVFRTRLLLAALTLDLFAVLFGGAVFLLPIFAKDILHVGAFGFGCLRAASSIGAVSMAMVQAHMPPFKKAGWALLATVSGFAIATIVFGLSRSYVLSFIMLILTGAFDNISVVIRHSLVPLLTPDRMRGRVFAVNQIFVGSSNELGGLESGLSAWWLGAKLSVVLGGVASLLVVLLVGTGFKQVRDLGSLHDVRPADDELPNAERQVENKGVAPI